MTREDPNFPFSEDGNNKTPDESGDFIREALRILGENDDGFDIYIPEENPRTREEMEKYSTMMEAVLAAEKKDNKITLSLEEIKKMPEIAQEIYKRVAESINPKIIKKFEETILGRLKTSEEAVKMWLDTIHDELENLIFNPHDEDSGAKFYPGWNSKDFSELFYILYGEWLDLNGE